MAFLIQEIRKIIKTVATICQILRLKRTKIQFRLGLCPRPRLWGSLQRSSRPAGWGGSSSMGKGVLWSQENPCNRRWRGRVSVQDLWAGPVLPG